MRSRITIAPGYLIRRLVSSSRNVIPRTSIHPRLVVYSRYAHQRSCLRDPPVIARRIQASQARIGNTSIYFQDPSSTCQRNVERYNSHPCCNSPLCKLANVVGRVCRARIRWRSLERSTPPGYAPDLSRASSRKVPETVLPNSPVALVEWRRHASVTGERMRTKPGIVPI